MVTTRGMKKLRPISNIANAQGSSEDVKERKKRDKYQRTLYVKFYHFFQQKRSCC